MDLPAKATLCLALALGSAQAEEEGWRKLPAEDPRWENAPVVSNGSLAALVLESPASLRLRGTLLPTSSGENKPPIQRPEPEKLLKLLSTSKETTLTVEGLGSDPITGFSRFLQPEDGRVKGTFRLGTSTITRTVLASREDGAVFIHLLAGFPGALSFQVSLQGPGDSKASIVERRQLTLSPPGTPASHVWVFPFESEVTPEGDKITVRGEGEALVIWNSGEKEAISKTLSRLAERYDPGHTPPDPIRIWHGVLETHLKSSENSP